MQDDNKRPDGTTLCGSGPEDVTVPDTYVEAHTGSTATRRGAAAKKTAQKKIDN